ncbi:MAG: amidohydrolase [Lachnospiraceae bacterium]
MNIRFFNAKVLLSNKENGFELLENQQLWVKGNRICYIGDDASLTKANAGEPILWDEEIDAAGNLLMPGFKNAHTHTAMTFLRSYADDLPLEEWLHQQIFPKEAQLTPDDIYLLTKLGIMEYLTSGITCNFDMYLNVEKIADAAQDIGFRTVQVSGLNDYGGTVQEMEEQYLKFNHYGELNSFVLGIHAEYTTSMKRMEEVATLAHKYQAPVYLHNSETRQEVEGCLERYHMTPTQVMDKIGMYDFGGGGYHCVWMDEKDLQIFKDRNLSVVTNPASNLKLASGIAPITQFLNKGINVAIGTDGAASNNCLDMFREMFLTTALAKVKDEDASSVPAENVLYMATTGGAKAMGLTDCDCLAPGKLADLIMIDLKQPNMQPENHIVKNLVYSGSKQNVKMTMVNGKILYRDGVFSIGEDPEFIYKKANEIIRKMK